MRQLEKIVLVTGAAGFIGRYTARCFHNHGWYVIGIGHGSLSEAERKVWGIDEWHMSDCSFAGLSAARGERASVIVHAAGSGSVGLSVKHPEVDFSRNAHCTAEVLGFIRQCAPSIKLIFLSSAAVYGMVKSLPIEEDFQLHPISPYGMHKKISEELCQLYGRQYGVSSIVVRLFSVYGAGIRKQLLWDACNKLASNKAMFWGTGQETRDWIHAEDVAELLFTAKDFATNVSPQVNGGSGKAVSIDYVVHELANSLNYDGEIQFNGQEDVGNPRDYLADVGTALSWGWQPKKDLAEGIKEYAEWFKAQR